MRWIVRGGRGALCDSVALVDAGIKVRRSGLAVGCYPIEVEGCFARGIGRRNGDAPTFSVAFMCAIYSGVLSRVERTSAAMKRSQDEDHDQPTTRPVSPVRHRTTIYSASPYRMIKSFAIGADGRASLPLYQHVSRRPPFQPFKRRAQVPRGGGPAQRGRLRLPSAIRPPFRRALVASPSVIP